MSLSAYFADMHIHIGRDIYDKPVKITGSKFLTLTNVLKEASRNKGLQLVGVIDSQAPAVQEEIKQLIDQGVAYELTDGGIRFEDVTLLLGAEIEVYDEACLGPIHVLCYFPTLLAIERFTEWLAERMKNVTLSSQRYYGAAKALQYQVKALGGLFIPAHVFTPFKSLYGKGVAHSLTEVLDPDLIDGIEIGLSADTALADQIEELARYTFLTNSDAHSLPKIAREYQAIRMQEPSFKEFNWALHQIEGRGFVKNFGMDPRLGKYYTTVCDACYAPASLGARSCSVCGSSTIIPGVSDRIKALADRSPVLSERAPYIYQVPLEYLPKLGAKTHEKLLARFGTEMHVIHEATYEELLEVVSQPLAKMIIAMRAGQLEVTPGGGGKFGEIKAT